MRKHIAAFVTVAVITLSLWPGNAAQESTEPSFRFDNYHNYEEISAEIIRISEEYSHITQRLVLGQTWEGRDIVALRVTDRPLEEEADEPDVLVMGNHHANELPSAEVPMFIMKYLVENYANDSATGELVDSRDIWFVPLVNPDGREYAMNSDPTWRKNRAPTDTTGDGIPEGIGVDLNRNYGHLWSLEGTSLDPTATNYCGPEAFSENETEAIKQLATDQMFELSLSYHTYGRQVSYPWGNSIDTLHPREDVLRAIANDLGDRTGYTVMEAKELYFTTGDSDDWLYSEFSALPFTIELGTQYAGPESELLELCQDNLAAALYAIDISAEPDKALLPEWGVMVYMSADADAALASEALVDINEMEVAGSTGEVNIFVLYDGMLANDTVLYNILKDPDGFNSVIKSAVSPPYPEADMSDPMTLRAFVNFIMSDSPAQKYMLTLWGHGDGVLRTFIPDKGIGMEIGEISQALEGFDIDIVGFDTCSLGHFEVAQELVGIADIMIGSEAKEPLSGWDYGTSLGKLVSEPSMEPRKLAEIIVMDYLRKETESYITQAAIDMRVFEEDFLPMMNDFGNVSLDFAYLDHKKIWSARNITDTFVTAQDAVDFFQFLENLEALEVSEPVMNRIAALRSLEAELVIAGGSGTAHPECNAMAVHFPILEMPVVSDYLDLEFCHNQWDEYLVGTKAPASRPVIEAAPSRTVDNTVGPYTVSADIAGFNGESIILRYRPSSGSWQSITATQGIGMLSAEIPGQQNGSSVEYYFLDMTNNITEPYEIKWGDTGYLTLWVNTSCDLSVYGITLLSMGPIERGNLTTFRIDCSNAGPEPVMANITLTLTGDSGTAPLGWAERNIGAGENITVFFNWTAEAGSWYITAYISQAGTFERNVSNQNAGITVEVTGSEMPENNFLTENIAWIIALIIIWAVPFVCILYILRKLRKRRKETAEQSVRAARQFLMTAAEFGADVSEAGILLARAEAALARNAFPECEKLVKKSRESAMTAVGTKGAGP